MPTQDDRIPALSANREGNDVKKRQVQPAGPINQQINQECAERNDSDERTDYSYDIKYKILALPLRYDVLEVAHLVRLSETLVAVCNRGY